MSKIKRVHPIRAWFYNNFIIDHPVCLVELKIEGVSVNPSLPYGDHTRQEVSKEFELNMRYVNGEWIGELTVDVKFDKEVNSEFNTYCTVYSMFGNFNADLNITKSWCSHEHIPEKDMMPYKANTWHRIKCQFHVQLTNHFPQLEK